MYFIITVNINHNHNNNIIIILIVILLLCLVASRLGKPVATEYLNRRAS